MVNHHYIIIFSPSSPDTPAVPFAVKVLAKPQPLNASENDWMMDTCPMPMHLSIEPQWTATIVGKGMH
jgi:hypothetical protein